VSFIIRYISKYSTPIERFLKFITNTGHKSEQLADADFDTLNQYNLDIKNCRGQSYDNASNMAGKYTGLQARIKEVGHNATETFQKLQQAYGEDVLSRAQVFRWFKAFSEGRKLIEDEPRSGRPSTSKNDENIAKVRNLVRSDRRMTLRMIGEQLGLSHTTVLN